MYDSAHTIDQVRDLLSANTLFSDWNSHQLDALQRISRLCEVRAGDVVFRQGQRCEYLHVLDNGLVKITHTMANGKTEQVCEFVKSPTLLCEHSAFLNNCYPVSAEALCESRILLIPIAELHDLLHREPDLMWKLTGMLARKVDGLLQRQQRQGSRNAEQRAAALLLEIFDKRDPWQVSRRAVKQVDMANMLSISPETFCRVLAGFRRRGWIGAEHGNITILDRRGLSGILPAAAGRPR